METIRVNMNPNPLDVQTIHASQNDGEARQWGFELHNNGDVIDSSEISDQLVFKAYESGTEEILPTNGSVPTTAPFLGDIRYPQGLLTDQEFLYRQSPTEEDGLAKITDIKGNTIVWNQLLNISVATSTVNGITYTINGDGSISISGTATATADKTIETGISFVSGHKYLLTGGKSADLSSNANAPQNWKNSARTDRANGTIIECINSFTGNIFLSVSNGATINTKITPMLIDLTYMFGPGNEPTTVAEFTALFPLPYYQYDAGSLLSVNGTGIKTVGKNLVSSYQSKLGVNQYGIALYCEAVMKPNTTYSISFVGQSGLSVYPNENMFTSQSWISMNGQRQTVTLTTKSDISNQHMADGWGIFKKASGSSIPFATAFVDVQIEVGSTATSYVPYTSSTLSLPVSTYFPNGMDGVGDAYDELTNSGYAKRMGRIDLGSITYTRQESQISGVYFFVGAYNSIPNIKNRANSLVWNIKTPLYETVPSSRIYQGFAQNKTIGGYDAQTVRIRDDSFTDPMDFKNSLGGQYLVYELATPTETSFTTASIVTENAEIPLSNEDGTLIGKCTEELSAEPGFIDAKIKLTDGDGTCYSNKIQLHVERKPS